MSVIESFRDPIVADQIASLPWSERHDLYQELATLWRQKDRALRQARFNEYEALRREHQALRQDLDDFTLMFSRTFGDSY